jgi:hypothetical protein
MTNEIEIVQGGNALRLGDGVTITFQRTLRIPDDGKKYPLPPGLGAFPLRLVRDYADRVPSEWVAQGGVFLPMFQREAMWLSFAGSAPRALQIGIGKVCAISGERWTSELERKPQNYVVTGHQPWLDGIASGKGTIRQFVAMPLGMGYTVEAQVTGEERFGGIQLQAFDPRPGRVPSLHGPYRGGGSFDGMLGAPISAPMPCAAPMAAGAAPQAMRRKSAGSMGLAAGGRMEQKIYPDPYGTDAWDPSTRRRVFVHIVNSEMWRDITGEAPPPSPVTAKSYTAAGLPWFSLYDEGAATVDPTSTLAQVKSVKELDEEKSTHPLQDDEPVGIAHVKKLWKKLRATVVDDGEW